MQLSTVHGNRLIRFYLLIYIQSAAPQLDFFYLTVSSTLSQEPTLTSQVHHSLISLSVFLCGESMFVYMVLVSVCNQAAVCVHSVHRPALRRDPPLHHRPKEECELLFFLNY